jgi:hypothetical protein
VDRRLCLASGVRFLYRIMSVKIIVSFVWITRATKLLWNNLRTCLEFAWKDFLISLKFSTRVTGSGIRPTGRRRSYRRITTSSVEAMPLNNQMLESFDLDAFCESRSQSSWTHLITPSRNFVEVWRRSLF